MGYKNVTKNYRLPQWSPDDKPTILGDLNDAMHTIDSSLFTVEGKANDILARVPDMVGLTGSVNALTTDLADAKAKNKSDLESLRTQLNESVGGATQAVSSLSAVALTTTNPSRTVDAVSAAVQDPKVLKELKDEFMPKGVPAVGAKTHYGCVGDGVADDTAKLQDCINDATSKGMTVLIEPGTYRVSRQADRTFALYLPTGARVSAYGATIIYDDAANPAPNATSFTVVSIGSWNTAADHVLWEGGTIVGNDSKASKANNVYICGIGAVACLDDLGFSSQGFNFPPGNGALWPKDWHDITIRDLYCYDVAVGVRSAFFSNQSAKKNSNMFNSSSQSRRWRVENCTVEKTSNKAVELAYVGNSSISGLSCVNVMDGPQFIGCVDSTMTNLAIEAKEAGISITENAARISISNFAVWMISGGLDTSSNSLGGLTFRREPVSDACTFTDIQVVNGTINATASTSKRALTFSHHNLGAGGANCWWRSIKFSNVSFRGTACIRDTASGSSGNFDDVYFGGCSFDTVETQLASAATFGALRFVDNCVTTLIDIKGDFGVYTGNRFKSGVTLTGNSNYFAGNLISGTFTKTGTSNSIQTNLVGSSYVTG